MRINKVRIYDFKNLNDFEIDFDQEEMYTVLLGQNAAGKSNFLEALVILFRDLFLDNDPVFSYDIEYQCHDYHIQVMARKDEEGIQKKDRYRIIIKEPSDNKDLFENDTTAKELSRTIFKKRHADFLPRYLIAYYSGVSNRLKEHFDAHQRIFYNALLKGDDDPLRPLFYARPIHSNFVLMSFFSFPDEDQKIKGFLEKYFGIIDMDSILFVIKRPDWAKGKSRNLIDNGKVSFWKAKGTVSKLLKELYDIGLAPIQDSLKIPVDFRRDETQERIYLYISNQEKLRKLATTYGDNVNFFKVLESTYISDFIHDVRIKVKKKDAEGNITFKEMSEGEQQLLTVLGLLRFTKSEQSLILLDEPDTHLNPIWKWRYIKLLREIVDKPDSTQIIITTHDPLVVGSMRKEEIRIFENSKTKEKIITYEPDESPKGMGVAAILLSPLFGLPSTLDEESQLQLTEKRRLEMKRAEQSISQEEELKLNKLEEELENRGVVYSVSDPLYQKFITAAMKFPQFQKQPMSKEKREEQDKLAFEILEKILAEEKK